VSRLVHLRSRFLVHLESALNLSGSHPQHEIVDKPWRGL
jgi:hypothetical protein